MDGTKITPDFFAVSSIAQAYTTFDRGHLSPNADFHFATFRRATHTYFNMVPMNAKFNQQEWSKLEGHVRKGARAQKVTATIFTGGIVIASSNNALTYETRAINLLNTNEDGIEYKMPANDKLPTIFVPDLLWKFVIVGSDGLALWMFEDGVKVAQTYCPDKCASKIFYCCDVQAFKDGTDAIKGNFNWPTGAVATGSLSWLL